MPDSPAEEAPPRPWQKWIVAVLGFLVVVHSLLLTLWLAPSSPIRDLVGSRGLASYVDPYFEQTADSIDPGAQYVDESFQVRAFVEGDSAKKPHVTPWIDLTAVEDHHMRSDLAPARVHIIARRLATNLNGVMFALDPKQRAIVPLTKVTTLPSKLEAKLNAAGTNPIAVQNFMAYEQMATQFSSLYAAAKWKGQIFQVQFKVGRRTVPAFAKRHTDKLSDARYLWFAFGWRPAFHGSLEAQTSFDGYVGH
jgi:hypothetical protein